MALIKAVLIAISMFVCCIIYSEIIEEEEARYFNEQETQSLAPRDESETDNSEYDRMELLTGEFGSIESPNFPTADHNLDYRWLIKVEESQMIRLDFLDFDTQLDYDYIFVHDGATTNDPVLLAVSGLYTTPAYRSSGNHMLIRFVTDNKITSRGFRANYFAILPCFEAHHASFGQFSSYNYPSQYDKNMRCDWLIKVGESEKILLEFINLHTEEGYDIIQVFDGGSDQAPIIDRVSGDYRGRALILKSLSNVVFIRFTTDSSQSETGFSALYSAGSDDDLNDYVYTKYPSLAEENTNEEEDEDESALDIDDKQLSFYVKALVEALEKNSTSSAY